MCVKMPIYEYVCMDCSNRFEKRLTVYDNYQEIKCPSCGHQSEKQFSVFATNISNDTNTLPMSEGCCGAGGCQCSGGV